MRYFKNATAVDDKNTVHEVSKAVLLLHSSSVLGDKEIQDYFKLILISDMPSFWVMISQLSVEINSRFVFALLCCVIG